MSEERVGVTPAEEPTVVDTSEATAQEQAPEQMSLFQEAANGTFEAMFPELTKEPDQQVEEKVETQEENVPEEQEAPKEEGSLEKRLADKDQMIARQADEVGQLRKEIQDMKLLLEEKVTPKTTESEQQLSPEETLLASSEDEIVAALIQNSGDTLDPDTARQQARIIKSTLTAAQKLVEKETAPLREQKQREAEVQNYNTVGSEFLKDKPDWKEKESIVKQIIDKAYPNGMPVDPYKNPEQFFSILQTGYISAGLVMENSKQTDDSTERARVVSKRQLNGSAAASAKPVETPKPKLSAMEQMIEDSFKGL